MNFASIVGANQLNSGRNQNSKLALKTTTTKTNQQNRNTNLSIIHEILVAELTIFSALAITT